MTGEPQARAASASAEVDVAAVEGQPLKAREHHERHHPSPRQYVEIAVILAFLTVVEVAVWYMGSLEKVLVPILLTLMVIKFAMVVLWFMHVRFDNPGFGRLFVSGLVLAATVYGIVLMIFGVFAR